MFRITLLLLYLPSTFLFSQKVNVEYNILDYGAVNDSIVLSTLAINKAITACYQNGGGRVLIPAGKFQSGTIILKSNVELHLESGATLYASRNDEDFPCQPQGAYRSQKEAAGWYALIYAVDQDNISITGSGTIDGRGLGRKSSKDGKGGDRDGRPRNILFITCKNVNILGISLNNSALWNQHYLNCEDVIIDKIRVYNHCNGNNDGIDIDGCRRFILSNSIIDADDDGIVMKSTGLAPCEDIAITNCIVSSRANAIKCGTESTGGFKNIAISNCVVKPTCSTDKPIAKIAKHGITGISLEVVDGGIMDGVTISNVIIHGTECPLFIRLGNRGLKYMDDAPEPPIGQIRNVFISNVTAYETGNYSSSITGIPSAKIENVQLDNIHFYNKGGLLAGQYRDVANENVKGHDTHADNSSDKYIASYKEVVEDDKGYPQPTVWRNLPSYGLFVRHVKNIIVNNATFNSSNPDPRMPVIAVDVDNLILRDIHIGIRKKQVDVLLKDVKMYSIDKELLVKVEK